MLIMELVIAIPQHMSRWCLECFDLATGSSTCDGSELSLLLAPSGRVTKWPCRQILVVHDKSFLILQNLCLHPSTSCRYSRLLWWLLVRPSLVHTTNSSRPHSLSVFNMHQQREGLALRTSGKHHCWSTHAIRIRAHWRTKHSSSPQVLTLATMHIITTLYRYTVRHNRQWR